MGRSPLGSPAGRALYQVPVGARVPEVSPMASALKLPALPDGGIGVRNSRGSEELVLRFTPDAWHAFLGGVKNGEFDDFYMKSPREQAVSCSPVLSQPQSPAQLIRKPETHIQPFTAWIKKWL
jgi:hypothetical protein